MMIMSSGRPARRRRASRRGLLVWPLVLPGLAGVLLGCAANPAARDEARLAWSERDEERGRQCVRAGGRWIAGECNYRCD
jgi:hypothetical protein